MRKMCHDCPHLREHRHGDEIVIFPEYKNKPHPCHNDASRNCVGAEIQLDKLTRNICQVEDYENVRTILTHRLSFAREL